MSQAILSQLGNDDENVLVQDASSDATVLIAEGFSEYLIRIFRQGATAKSFDYSRPVYVPVLSGCLMFTRRSALEAVGGFDERFFPGRPDFCRRIGSTFKSLFWPYVTVTHAHGNDEIEWRCNESRRGELDND